MDGRVDASHKRRARDRDGHRAAATTAAGAGGDDKVVAHGPEHGRPERCRRESQDRAGPNRRHRREGERKPPQYFHRIPLPEVVAT